MDGPAGHLFWPSFTESRGNPFASAGGLGASPASLVPFLGSLADVISLPDMDFSTYRGGRQKRTPSLLSRVREGVERKPIDYLVVFQRSQ